MRLGLKWGMEALPDETWVVVVVGALPNEA